MTQIIIQIRDGAVQSIAANAEIEYLVIDWDVISEADEIPSMENAFNEDYFFEDADKYLGETKSDYQKR